MSEWELTSDWEKERIDADPPEGTPSWLELSVPDPDRAREFYGTLFGWTFEDDLCLLDGLPVAAIRLLGEGPGEPDGPEWTVFFATDDCDRTVERVSAAGGRILREPHEVEGRGRAALVADVLGARFGLWQGRELVGTRLVNGYNTFIFNELHTSEQDRALAFYEEVFGYSNRDGDLKRPDGHTVAAIVFPRILEEIDEDDEDDKQYLQRMRGSVEFPDLTAWLTYFAVPDAQEAVDLLLSIGGWAHEEEGVTENPWGRLAAVKDPFGTPFRLVLPWEVI